MSHQVSLRIHVYIKKCIKSTFFFSDGNRTQVTIWGPNMSPSTPQPVQRRYTGPDLAWKRLISCGCVPSSPSITTSVCSLNEGPQKKKKVPNVHFKRTQPTKAKFWPVWMVVIFTRLMHQEQELKLYTAIMCNRNESSSQ